MTKPKKVSVEEEAAFKDNAAALLSLAEVDLTRIEIEQEQLELRRDRRKFDFESSCDFESNFYVFDDAVTESEVCLCKSTLRRMSRLRPRSPITIELNSGGGSIIDGFSLMDEIIRLKSKGHHITIRVQGQAASMAAVLLQVADRREIGRNSFLMIHRAAFGAIGKSYEIEDEIEFVRKLEHQIATTFSNASGRPVEDFKDFFDKRRDVWFDAEEALANKLVDAIV